MMKIQRVIHVDEEQNGSKKIVADGSKYYNYILS